MDSQRRSQHKPTIVFKFKNPIEATEQAKEEYSDYEEELEDGTVLSGSCNGDDRGLIKKKKIVASSGVGGGGSANGKGRSLVGGVPPTLCQVDNCAADLVGAKRYHQRHKVCEVHAKAAVVVVAGLRQRFCQQCSRFHELSAFDEARRSCRSRLAGHNERRRKSTSEAAQVDVKGSSRRQSLSLSMKEKPRQLGERERGITPAALHEKQFQLR